MDAMVYHCYVVTPISSNLEDTLDATVPTAISKQLAARYGCYVVTSISSNLEDASDATFQQPFESTSRTLWMLRCTIATL